MRFVGLLWLALSALVVVTFAVYCRHLYVASLPLWVKGSYYVPWLGYHLVDLSVRVALVTLVAGVVPGALVVRASYRKAKV